MEMTEQELRNKVVAKYGSKLSDIVNTAYIKDQKKYLDGIEKLLAQNLSEDEFTCAVSFRLAFDCGFAIHD